jgi:hypothetical protein
MYDWLFIVPRDYGPPIIELPSRVKIDYSHTLDELARKLVTSLDEDFIAYPQTKQVEVVAIMSHVVIHQPYILVEFKPTLGYVFQSLLRGYSHWAYADIDMILGRVDKLISAEILHAYDIVTTNFGDTFVIYMRGQLTIHKNQAHVNNIWKNCIHYHNITNRLLEFDRHGRITWPFESAEGCYSHAVIRKSNTTVLIVTSQFSDAYSGRLELRESMLVGKALVQCYNLPIDLYGKVNQRDKMRAFLKADYYTGDRIHHAGFTANQSALTRVYMRRYKCVKLYWYNPIYEVSFSSYICLV